MDLEDQVGAVAALLQAGVEPDQGHLEEVGGETLDPGVHGLALGGLADLVVGRHQIR